ncbi:alpha/beta hydrolase [Luteimonas sp. RD2P54]|uniref:Alpha/beta hydrolase n=1 Tax=Luteimonas endophytica TaxID=3042023 RepID=A0ABT6J3U7_9GAMM|nr:alpha/beta fold hydrolase [Luteimonas endophytica]MDH5821449.1 alpha/beta hydrolase [Luteimonas endophytica]
MAKTALALLGIAALAYAAVCALLYLQQRSLVYYPQFTRSDAAGTDFAIDRGDAVLRGWIANPGHADAVLYFGGNAERVEDNREDLARWLPARTGYLPAYRGYGASDGTPGETALLGDALALFDLVRARHPDGRIAVIGRSLGSAVAAHVAAHREVERLVLVTPFDSMVEVARGHYPWLPVRWLLRERYEAIPPLRRHDGPLLVLRAGADTVVPPRHADRLVAALPRRPEVRDFPNAGHNDIHLQPGYGEAISDFLR